MINSDQQLETTWERLRQFQPQLAWIRETEANPADYRLSAAAFLAESDRMALEMREYLWSHPSDVRHAAGA